MTVPPPHPPSALGDPAPSAVWTFVGGLIVAWVRMRAGLTAVALILGAAALMDALARAHEEASTDG